MHVDPITPCLENSTGVSNHEFAESKPIYARTLPDEFNGAVGNERMMKMDSEVLWLIFVKARNAEQAIKVLSEEALY